MSNKPKWIPYVAAAILTALAVSFFLITFTRTLDSTDEGFLLLNFHKAANGQIPHRDFYDVYGPASYWLAASLFDLFGEHILVIRFFLITLKAAMTLMVFLIARKLVPTLFAFIAGILFVLNWGDPFMPATNILYAGHVQHFLLLLGIFMIILYAEKSNKLWLIGTSACMGLSLLFKLHTAIIGVIGFSIFLSLKEQAEAFARNGVETGGENRSKVLIGAMRAGKCVGAASVILFYLVLFSRYHLDLYYFFIFLLPLYLIVGRILFDDLRSFRIDAGLGGGLGKCYTDILILLSGPLIFWACELAYFYRVGGLEEFFYDVFVLPFRLNYYIQMADYRLHAGLIAAIVVTIFGMVAIGKRLETKSGAAVSSLWLVSIGVTLIPTGALILRNTSLETWHSLTVHIVPSTTLLVSAYLFLRKWGRRRRGGDRGGDMLLWGLLLIFACQTFLISYPRTDEAHIQMNSTVLYILVALLLWRLCAAWESLLPRGGRIAGAISVVVCLLVFATPYVWSMKTFRFFSLSELDSARRHMPPDFLRGLEEKKSYPTLDMDFPRSSGLSIPMWSRRPLHDFFLVDTFRIIEFLRRNTEADERILVLCESQIVYFLAERESPLGKEDYFLYLASVGLIDDADDTRLSDEQFVKRLAEAKPRFILEAGSEKQTHRIFAVWPGVADFIEENYETAQTFGAVYRVLQYRDASPKEPALDGG